VTVRAEAVMREFSGSDPIGLIGRLRARVRACDLPWSWVVREMKIRRRQSILRAAWAVLHPLALMLMFTLVFSVLVDIETGDVPYLLLAYTAVLPWTLLHTSIAFSIWSL